MRDVTGDQAQQHAGGLRLPTPRSSVEPDVVFSKLLYEVRELHGGLLGRTHNF